MHDTGGDAVGNADQLAVVGCGPLGAPQEITPVEVGMPLGDLRRDPAGHADRPLHHINAAAAGAEFGAQPGAPGIDGQEGEIDLDAGLLFEFRCDLLHHGPMPRAVVADIDQLFRLALRLDLRCRQHAAGGNRGLQQAPPVQSGHDVSPSIFWVSLSPRRTTSRQRDAAVRQTRR